MLKEKEISIYISYIGEYFTSMEMGGYSITLTKLDDELKRLLNAPAHSPLFIQN
jgi:dihydroxyacetone kinase-like protein